MNWPFWLELLARSSILLLAVEGLQLWAKRWTAAARHRLLLGAFVALALLPVVSILFPEIPIRLWESRVGLRGYVTAEEVSVTMLQTRASHQVDWPVVIWLTGFLVACAPLAVGLLSARRMVSRAEAFHQFRGTEVLLSSELRIPVTCGLITPRIVLPVAARDWSAQRLQAVLLHELAHVRRRDVAAQMGLHLISAIWWFQPLVWISRSRLRLESELACDAEVVSGGIRASQYAAELLGIAQSVRGDWRFSSSVIGMARPSGLEDRVRAVLQPRMALKGRWRFYLAAIVLGAVSMAASTMSFEKQGGSSMRRTLLSALLTSAGLSAATVSGFIHDASGAAVADAKVSLYSPETEAKQEAVTGADGKFTLSGDGGQTILRVEKAGMASIFSEFNLKKDANLDNQITMAAVGGNSTANATIGPDAQPRRIRVGGQVAQSNLVTKVNPVYPMAAKKAGVQGTVEIAATISKEGVPVELRVNSSPGDDLSESALVAVGQWRYRPTLLNGQPIEIETIVIVNYTLAP